VSAQSKFGFDPLLERSEPDFLESLDRPARKRLMRHVGKRHTPPEVERLPQKFGCAFSLPLVERRRGIARQPLEPAQIELVGVKPNDIAR
jgi:hypothetical protein